MIAPGAGTRLFFLGTEGVLFSAPRQELHAFNASACVIWCHLEDGLAPPAIAAALAASSGVGLATATAHVTAALADWATKGLLDGTPRVPLRSPALPPVIDLPPWQASKWKVRLHYRMAGVTVLVRFARPAHAALVAPLFAHCRLPARQTPHTVIDIAPAGGRIGLYTDRVPAAIAASDADLAPAAKAAVWMAVLRRQHHALQLHAAVLDGPAGCVLLPAAAGSGKSTRTAALAHAGFTVFSDDAALLQADGFTAAPFPMAMCVKTTGFDVLAPLYPQLPALPVHRRGDGKHVAYIAPASAWPDADAPPRPVCGIVFPCYVEGAATRLRELGAAEALARLMAQCLHVVQPLDIALVDRMVRWIAALPVAELSYGDLASPCAVVGAVLRGERIAELHLAHDAPES